MINRGVLMTVLLAVLVSLIIWFGNRGALPLVTEETTYSGPEYTVENFSLTATREDGSLHYISKGEQLTKWANNPKSSALGVWMEMHSNEQEHWMLKANEADINQQQELAWLRGNVVITREAMQDKPAIRITTEQLDMDLKNDRVQSDADVFMKQGESTITGTGLRADFNRGSLQLNANVRGVYVP